jgi:diguanylate cyclase (GGDEF)-like protein
VPQRDPLTGLGHPAAFAEALRRARQARGVAVLLVDVDGLSAINDARGHQAGDRVLVGVGAALADVLRHGDEVFRVGGDEFAAIVHVDSAAEALEAGRRLREAVAHGSSVTVSVGVAVPRGAESEAGVLMRAEQALAAVKGQRRAAVELAP